MPQKILHIRVNQYKEELTFVLSGVETLKLLPQELQLRSYVLPPESLHHYKNQQYHDVNATDPLHIIKHDLHHIMKNEEKILRYCRRTLAQLNQPNANCNI